MRFYRLDLPTGDSAWLPEDIRLQFHDEPTLTPRQRCATAFIPWQWHYLESVPAEYQDFFQYTLPYMSARTTDVHTACSVSHAQYLIDHASEPVNGRVVHLVVIMHDIGWSNVSLDGIATSLSYDGLTLPDHVRLPKLQHVLMSTAMAWDIMDAYDFQGEPLSEAEKRLIALCIRQHDYDQPWERHRTWHIPMESRLVFDSDRLWSYTHENFWQDTVRKAVQPHDYLMTISNAIDGYFATPQAKLRAAILVDERRAEVRTWQRQTAKRSAAHAL